MKPMKPKPATREVRIKHGWPGTVQDVRDAAAGREPPATLTANEYVERLTDEERALLRDALNDGVIDRGIMSFLHKNADKAGELRKALDAYDLRHPRA